MEEYKGIFHRGMTFFMNHWRKKLETFRKTAKSSGCIAEKTLEGVVYYFLKEFLDEFLKKNLKKCPPDSLKGTLEKLMNIKGFSLKKIPQYLLSFYRKFSVRESLDEDFRKKFSKKFLYTFLKGIFRNLTKRLLKNLWKSF